MVLPGAISPGFSEEQGLTGRQVLPEPLADEASESEFSELAAKRTAVDVWGYMLVAAWRNSVNFLFKDAVNIALLLPEKNPWTDRDCSLWCR